MKKVLSCLLVVSILLAALPLGAISITASAASYSGSCGDNVYWSLDTSTGVLDITGTGDMYDYDSMMGEYHSWYSYNNYIKTVNIANGVTSIGGSAFYFCKNLTGLTIPDSITKIGWLAFSGCLNLESITIPGSFISLEYSHLSNITTIYGVSGSAAERYARSNGNPFIAIPEKIKVFSLPDKTVYAIGEEFDPEGIIVALYHGDGKLEFYWKGFEFSGFDSDTLGTKTVTVSYLGAETQFNVTVSGSVVVENPNSTDIVRLKKTLFANNGDTLTMYDYNGDGKINILDIIAMKKLVLASAE